MTITDTLLLAILILTAINSVTLAVNAWLRWKIVEQTTPRRTTEWRMAAKVVPDEDIQWNGAGV